MNLRVGIEGDKKRQRESSVTKKWVVVLWLKILNGRTWKATYIFMDLSLRYWIKQNAHGWFRDSVRYDEKGIGNFTQMKHFLLLNIVNTYTYQLKGNELKQKRSRHTCMKRYIVKIHGYRHIIAALFTKVYYLFDFIINKAHITWSNLYVMTIFSQRKEMTSVGQTIINMQRRTDFTTSSCVQNFCECKIWNATSCVHW